MASAPRIWVSGESTADTPATLTINGDTMQLILTSGEPIYIDSDAKAAYRTSGSTRIYAGNQVMIAAGSDWFKLNPEGTNNNSVSVMSGINEIRIQPRWRFF